MNKVIIELKHITQYFPGVVALNDMSFTIREGMVHGLIGENGAGKSTLIKVLTGINHPDKGQIFIDGKEVQISNPVVSKALGIGCIYQELNICPDMSVTDNLFLNSYLKKGLFLNYREMNRLAAKTMEDLGQPIDPGTLCGHLGLGVQQAVEIGKSVLSNSRLIIMDEPTSSLSEAEVEQLFATIETLKKRGVSIIFVSHKLEEIFRCCDDVTVMRDGHLICTKPTTEMTKDDLIAYMVGRPLGMLYPKEETQQGEEMLRVEDLCSPGLLYHVNFTAYAGQILGFSGLVGAGRTETMRAIFGIDPNKTGSIYIRGKKVSITRPRDAIKNSIAFLTEDRKREGLILDASVKNNLHLATIDKDVKGLFLDDSKHKTLAEENIRAFKIKTPSIDTPVGTLSGGNQQKVVIAKWVNTSTDIFIFDEPTRGIDVGAKIEVYNVMNELVKSGKCVIMISSELPEILGMSDRVIVMRHGKVMAEIDRHSEHFNQEDIMKASWGGRLS